MSRRIMVRITAFWLRHGVSAIEALDVMSRSHRHRDSAWRMLVIADAQARNDARKAGRH